MSLICESCGHETQIITIDDGIGPYEFWGQRGVHRQLRDATACCEAEAIDGGCKLVETKIRIAKKNHGNIKIGDKYEIKTYRSYRANGGSWYHSTKRKIS